MRRLSGEPRTGEDLGLSWSCFLRGVHGVPSLTIHIAIMGLGLYRVLREISGLSLNYSVITH